MSRFYVLGSFFLAGCCLSGGSHWLVSATTLGLWFAFFSWLIFTSFIGLGIFLDGAMSRLFRVPDLELWYFFLALFVLAWILGGILCVSLI